MLAPPLRFRQSHCHEQTAFVTFFVPVRRTDPNQGRALALLVAYVSLRDPGLVFNS